MPEPGVLSRHESLAANLGAKLTAPRLLRAMESLFEGSIAASPKSPFGDPLASTWYTPSWLEIVEFAAANPGEFSLTTTPDGRRVCQFNLRNVCVEIGEDDWRLIMSGALDRFRLVPPQPLEEDEVAELATLDILEKRLRKLIKDADEVARRARQLNYRLSGRKAAINSRRSSPHSGNAAAGYPPASQPPQPHAPLGGLNPAYDLHADLLQQFLSPSHQQSGSTISQPPSVASESVAPAASELPRPSILTSGAPVANPKPQPHILTPNGRRTPLYPANSPTRGESTGTAPSATSTPEEHNAPHRSILQARVEKLARGDHITPPCDRCRRLKSSCIKHLTSCQGCTRKHSKCTWKSVTDAEIDVLRGELTEISRGGPTEGSGGSREVRQRDSEDLPEPGEAAETDAVSGERQPQQGGTEADIETDTESPETKGKHTPPSSASSTRDKRSMSITTGRHRN